MSDILNIDRHRIEREREKYRISIGLGVALAGFLALHTVDRPKLRAAYYLVIGVIAFGAGLISLGSGSREKL